MKWLERNKMKFMLIGIVAGIVFGAGSAKADFTFGEPVNLGPTINSSYVDMPSCISVDGLELYIFSNRPGTLGDTDLWVLTRTTKESDWEAPVNLGAAVNSPARECCSCLSADGLELYFDAYNRPGGYGAWDIWISRRQTRNDPWSTAVNVGPPINTSSWDESPSISGDSLKLYFCSTRPDGQGSDDIWVAKRATTNDSWEEPFNLGSAVNSSARECGVKVSLDSLWLFFSGDALSPYRPGGFGLSDIWTTRRATRDNDVWNESVNLGPVVNSSSQDFGPVISPEADTLYFSSNRPGGSGDFDIYQAPIIPIVDLNSDHKVDEADMHIMVDHWGENYPLCNIGPTPLGDGVVDIHDFIVLTEHLYQIAAHWKLDETEGSIAYDSVGDYDGTINGNPSWQPAGGMKGGSLFLDGIDDFIETPFILDPSKGPFSVFAWVYCWMPGKVIISQQGESGGTWLGIDSSGNLMSGLGDNSFSTLVSETIIADAQWHHVGFVYDMDTLHRRLYVDGVLITEDTTVVIGDPSNNGLYIGASKDLSAGTLFSGFIDDVRIYKQALSPKEIVTFIQ